MRTTLNIDEEVLRKVVAFTGIQDKSKAVNEALRLYLRWKAVKEIKALKGKLEIEDTREELREKERQRWENSEGVGPLRRASGE